MLNNSASSCPNCLSSSDYQGQDCLNCRKLFITKLKALIQEKNMSGVNKFINTSPLDNTWKNEVFFRYKPAESSNKKNQVSQEEIRSKLKGLLTEEGFQYISDKTIKIESVEILSELTKNGIKCLYHFTDLSNWKSIQKMNGLFSWRYLCRNNIIVSKPGGNPLSHSLDTRKCLDEYVSLSFNRDHPMLFVAKKEKRILNPIIIEVDISVTLLISTSFSNINAIDNNANIGIGLSDLELIDLPFIQSGIRWNGEKEKKSLQAEVLVRERIPMDLFVKQYPWP